MWNPIQDIAESWSSAASGWGKISVVTYFFFCWLWIVTNLFLFMPSPLELMSACHVESIKPSASMTTYIVFLLRCWSLTGAFFLILLVWIGWTLSTTAFLACFWVLNYVALLPWRHNAYDVCFKGGSLAIGSAVLALALVAFGFKWMDDKIKSGYATPAFVAWNPVQDIAKAWGSTASHWGKISVVAYFLVCWILVLLNIFTLVNPLIWDNIYTCSLKSLHPPDTIVSYVSFLFRLWKISIIFLYVLLAWSGWTLRNTGVLASFWLAMFLLLPWSSRLNEDMECIMDFHLFGLALLVMVVIALPFKWIDDKIKARSSTPGETTPLNIGV